MIHSQENWNISVPYIFAVKHIDEKIRESSRSGGAFTAFSDYFINNNGVVYGCVMDNPYHAVHRRACNAETRDLMRGSKYIQSNLGNIFREVKNDLELSKLVLFTGTSCQVKGLKKFLGIDYSNLYTIDIICHGVPSALVWDDYVKYIETKYSKKAQSVDFRNKKDYGWSSHVESITFSDGSKIDTKSYATLFYDHKILRPCCYKCPYKSIVHPGDITIGDYWGIEKVSPEFFDDNGVSLALINSKKGRSLFERCQGDMVFLKQDISSCLQPPLIGPFERPKDREAFWEYYRTHDFKAVLKKYSDLGKKYKIHVFLYHVKRKVKERIFKMK